MSNFWREIQNGLSDCKYWCISEKILSKEYFNKSGVQIGFRALYVKNVKGIGSWFQSENR